MGNNLNNLTIIEIYGQKYSVVKLVPLRVRIICEITDSDKKRYVTVTPSNVSTNTKNFLMSYALISPQFWIDRGNALYILDEIDFGFNIKDLAVAEDFIESSVNIKTTSDYFGKDKMLSDEIITFPEINFKTPLMWTYWDTPQSNPILEFISTNRSLANIYDVFFSATLVKLHIIPDDLIEPTVG